MSMSEKKGRFTVSFTEQPKPSQSPPPAASPSTGLARAVKRGRFLVSCLPCVSSPCLTSTMSFQEEQVGLCSSSHDSLTSTDALCHSRSVGDILSMHSSSTVPSSCGYGAAAPCSKPASATHPQLGYAVAAQAVPLAHSPEPRRVRFSEDADAPQQHTFVHPGDLQLPLAPAGSGACAAAKHHRLLQPQPLACLKHTRSYCSGRFTVQESVAMPANSLHRSISAPDCAVAAGAVAKHHLERAASPCSAAGDTTSTGSSSSSLLSSSCFASASAMQASNMLAADELLHALAPSPLPPPSHTSAPLSDCSHALLRPAVSQLSSAGGMHAAALSVPQPLPVHAAGPCQAHGVQEACSVELSHVLTSAAHRITWPAGQPSRSDLMSVGDGCVVASTLDDSSLLSSYHSSSSADVLPFVAGAKTRHHQGLGLKRSPSISYFRRGRFMVQTTMG